MWPLLRASRRPRGPKDFLVFCRCFSESATLGRFGNVVNTDANTSFGIQLKNEF